jgi:imidazolonepropionase-like amidohydrolase
MSAFTDPSFLAKAAAVALISCSLSCTPPSNTHPFVRVQGHLIALAHVRVIDGTGSAPREDQTILIRDGLIQQVGESGVVSVPAGAIAMNLAGDTLIPGLVGMHDHLFYPIKDADSYKPMPVTFPRLYLASGVTTIRTAGSMDLDADRKIKQAVDEGKELGPHIFLTSPFVNSAEQIKAIDSWTAQGVTSVKAYTQLRRTDLAALIEAAHHRGLKVTGHLCAVGFEDAIRLGIDNLEHGLFVDTEFYSERHPDQCPNWLAVIVELADMDVHGKPIQDLIRNLVDHHVAITSTLAVFETFADSRIKLLDPRTLDTLSPEARAAYVKRRDRGASWPDMAWGPMLKNEMRFEREFVKAGGLLMAGSDPTGWGGVVAGFGDQRELELLVEAGFSPEEAIHIVTANGAAFLGKSDQIGAIQAGKTADLVVLRGNPSLRISDVKNVEIVFKDGVGYDSAAIIRSVAGKVGIE